MKTLCRVCAMIFALLLTLSLAACAQDDPAQESQSPVETEPAETEPMVRLYFQTESISNGRYTKYEYEENWWEKGDFIVTVNDVDEDGNETVIKQYINTAGKIRTECDDADLDYSSVSSYENGKMIHTYTDYHDHLILLSATSTNEYDQFGRLVKATDGGKYVDSEYDHNETRVYEYTDTDTGSVGRYIVDDEIYEERYYDQNFRLVESVRYLYGKVLNRTVYENNSAGCQTKAEVTNQNGEVFWTRVLYDYVEVPLSVALKYPMFKWEYIN